MRVKCYSDLERIRTFEERYDYLRLGGSVGQATEGAAREDECPPDDGGQAKGKREMTILLVVLIVLLLLYRMLAPALSHGKLFGLIGAWPFIA